YSELDPVLLQGVPTLPRILHEPGHNERVHHVDRKDQILLHQTVYVDHIERKEVVTNPRLNTLSEFDKPFLFVIVTSDMSKHDGLVGLRYITTHDNPDLIWIEKSVSFYVANYFHSTSITGTAYSF